MRKPAGDKTVEAENLPVDTSKTLQTQNICFDTVQKIAAGSGILAFVKVPSLCQIALNRA